MTKQQRSKARRALIAAIAKIGGPTATGRLFINPKTNRPLTRQAVMQWYIAPTERVLKLAEYSHKTKEDLRPDVYTSTSNNFDR